MKKLNIILLSLLSCFLLTESVDNKKEPYIEYDYSEVRDKNISNPFCVDKDIYYVYCYLTTCKYCNTLKNEVIKAALKRSDIYFFNCDDIPFCEERTNYINVSSLEDLNIYAVPLLLYIVEGKISQFYLGVEQIKSCLNFY
ncbi:MAG: hypothetical protein HUJ61_04400 [Bacilli bacterium]|nr:hypothetical protein [Bacilli bacterium]